ncbi:MFS transporter [Desulfosarcina ovata]|uniref:MFS transporter n=1 Tax=Desulfosarcina ovata subsp. ovata TaxID=2752305 RepID=A0A5K8A4P0_9BACT|nr:MFS transporter [Desulfosarcina ovata]BBO87378.1 MFS transporter [Desulfosarcina ovata subsp. ovata]
MVDRIPPTLIVPIAGTTFFKLVINVARRFAYPFAPALSRGMGVSLSAVTSLIAINQVTSLLGALIGPLSDRLGYRRMMIVGMAMLGLGMLAAAIFPFYAVVLTALLLAGLGKSILDPAAQAWAGSRVPYRRRAMVIGIMEISWSGSTLVGIPLIAVLMERYGWRSPFLLIGVLGLTGMIVLFFIIPPEPQQGRKAASTSPYLGVYAELLTNRPALGAMGYAFFVSAANDNLFVVYGAWLERSFGLGLVALGLGTSLIGMAELVGEGLTAMAADRIGVKRSVFTGVSLSMAGYFLLPWLDASLPAAMTGLALLFLTFEFAMVSSFSLCTELLPGFRATMMAGFYAMAGLGRAFGALTGGAVWLDGGILATGCLSGALTLIAIVCLVAGLKGWRQTIT